MLRKSVQNGWIWIRPKVTTFLMTKTFKSSSFFHQAWPNIDWLCGSFVTFFGPGMRIDNQFVKSVEQFDIQKHPPFHRPPTREQIDLFSWSRNMKNNGRECKIMILMLISSSFQNHELFYEHYTRQLNLLWPKCTKLSVYKLQILWIFMPIFATYLVIGL